MSRKSCMWSGGDWAGTRVVVSKMQARTMMERKVMEREVEDTGRSNSSRAASRAARPVGADAQRRPGIRERTALRDNIVEQAGRKIPLHARTDFTTFPSTSVSR